MTKVIQSTIAERQSEAATAPLNFESKVFRQRTGLFDQGTTKALASLTPYSPLSFEGTATAEQSGTIATANIPIVAGLTHGQGEKVRFVGPQMTPRAKDFRQGGMKGIGSSEDADKLESYATTRKPRPRRRADEGDADYAQRKQVEIAAWEQTQADGRYNIPGVYYRAYKEGMADWLLGIDPVTSRDQWSDDQNFNARRLLYWKRSVPQVDAGSATNMDNAIARDFLGASTESIPFATSKSQAVSAGYGQFSEAGGPMDKDSPVMIDAALPIGIRQFRTDEIATNYIANNRNRVVIGYTIGSRNVKLFYSPAAVDMVNRRFSSIYQLFGSMNPRISYLGRGHLRTNVKSRTDPQGYELWAPASDEQKALEQVRPYLQEPNLNWSAGAVAYNTKQLPANGQIYIDPNQMGYATRKKFCKYNHVMTQLGLALMETFSAFGAGLNDMLVPMNNAFIDDDGSAHVAGLQMLFSALFGTTAASTINSDDWTEDAGASNAHSRMASIMGMFFNPGHSHIDPGVLVFQNEVEDKTALSQLLKAVNAQSQYEGDDAKFDSAFNNDSGMLDTSDLRYRFCDMNVSAALLMNEAIGRLFVFATMGASLSQHMTVPTMMAKLEYHNNAGRDSVIQSLKMAHRPGIVAEGGGSGSGLPFDLIDSRITQQVVARIPCYLRDTSSNRGIYNTYVGISTPDPIGKVEDKVSDNGICTTLLEGDDITFTPIVRGGSGTMMTKRKGVTINITSLTRPEYFEPGVTKLGAIYGLMSDNKSVAGNYFLQPATGAYHDDRVPFTMFRSLAGSESKTLYALVNPDVSRAQINKMTEWYETRGLKPWENFTYIPIDTNGNIDWEKWQLMYVDAGIDINPDMWRRAILQDINVSRNAALYPPAAPSFETTMQD